MQNNNEIVQISLLEDGILQISLNRPDYLNALSMEVLKRLQHIFHEAKHDILVKAILLTGEGKGFCAGADIKELASLTGPQGHAFARFGQQVFSDLECLGKPSLAAIHGFALGGGCELAMSAALRIASAPTVFGQPEIKLGVIPGFGGTQRLSRVIGKGRAMQVCLLGGRFKAEEARQWGLINEVTAPEDLLPRAMDLLKELIQLPSFALESVMTVINKGYDLPLEEALELEAAHFGLCCATTDKREGVHAFLEKRTAVFNGE